MSINMQDKLDAAKEHQNMLRNALSGDVSFSSNLTGEEFTADQLTPGFLEEALDQAAAVSGHALEIFAHFAREDAMRSDI